MSCGPSRKLYKLWVLYRNSELYPSQKLYELGLFTEILWVWTLYRNDFMSWDSLQKLWASLWRVKNMTLREMGGGVTNTGEAWQSKTWLISILEIVRRSRPGQSPDVQSYRSRSYKSSIDVIGWVIDSNSKTWGILTELNDFLNRVIFLLIFFFISWMPL